MKSIMGFDFDDVRRTETKTTPIGDVTTKGAPKTLNMFFIVDVSGSMRFDGRMDAVNEAFEKMIPKLRDIQLEKMSAFEMNIAIMTFEQEAKWIVSPTPILEYVHQKIECTEYVTFYSNAYAALDEKLSSKEFMGGTGKKSYPYIMFMTDGEPTEDDNYGPALDELLENAWFKRAMRYAVLMGDEAINSPSARAAVERFTSDGQEGIINAMDAEEIAEQVEARTIKTIITATKHGGNNEGGKISEDIEGEDDPGQWLWDFDDLSVFDEDNNDFS